MSGIKVSVINESHIVTDDQVSAATSDLQTQVSRDFVAAWGIDAELMFVRSGSEPERGSWWLLILDNSDQAGALGYHDLTNEGLPLGKVFAGTDIKLGSSWTVTASHELLEMLADPDINLTAFVQSGDTTGKLYAYEVADACEADNYGYLIGETLVSDFVFPAWFESFAVTGAQLDQQGQIQQPFEILPGGYIGVFDITAGTGWQQVGGQNARANYRSRAHVGSRRERRRASRDVWLKSKRAFRRSTFGRKLERVPFADGTPEPVFKVEGKMSTFGGPNDKGVGPDESLALFEDGDVNDPRYADLFLPEPPPGTTGLARRLNPEKYYLACRWDYGTTSREFLRNVEAVVENPSNGKQATAQPADWGPSASTGRVSDLSPGLADALGLDTDQDVVVTIYANEGDGHGPANPISKPPIKQFIPSPNHSSRNGAKIEMIVLHCTEGNLQSAIEEFTNPNGRQVSAHYVIDVNGDIYQMVQDSERAYHARGANQNSIGIEHVGQPDDAITFRQAAASASLIRWLLAEYEIPRTEIYGHDFAPGYDQSRGGTSCPDRLFGKDHDQQTIDDWVANNV